MFRCRMRLRKDWRIGRMSDLISRSEIWKPIPEYEEIYEVSNFGNVRSVDRYLDCKIKNVNKHLWKGRIISQQKRKDGRLTVALYSHSKRKRMLVHRVVADASYQIRIIILV